MRFVTYVSPGSGEHRVGAHIGDNVHGLPDRYLVDLLGDDGERLARAGERARQAPLEVVPVDSVRLEAPIPRPPVIWDFASFEQHLRASREALGQPWSDEWYDQPTFYFQNAAAIHGPHDHVAIPPGTGQWDYELEICAVVGREGSNLTPDEAEDHIAGYMLFCDWSARDIQAREKRLGAGAAKSKDSATTIGPALVTPDELEPFRTGKGFDLRMTARVNGDLLSDGNLKEIHWSFGEMLSYASRGTRLLPGSIAGSGTVGSGCLLELILVHGGDRYRFLEPGDVVRLEVARLGALELRVGERTLEGRRPS